MGYGTVIGEMIESKLLDLHTAFFAKVLSFDGQAATVQPLSMYKQYGKPAQKSSVITGVPVLSGARYKVRTEMRTCGTGITGSPNQCTLQTEQRAHLVLDPLQPGDIVFCVCGERNITETKKGNFSLPPVGHHLLSDAVVVGVME